MVRFSVLIPAYNEEKYLKRCVDSIPKRKNIEIWICDDCSTDDTAGVINSFNCIKNNIYVIWHLKNKGRAKSMDDMLKHARGDIILKLDADMEIISKDIFMKLIDIYKDSRVGGVAIFGHTKDIEKQQKGIAKLEYKFYNMINKRKEEMLPIDNLSGLTHPLDIHCWRKELVPHIPNDIIHDDGYAALKVLQQGYKIVNGKIIIHHLKPPANLIDMIRARKRGRDGWKQLEMLFDVKLKGW